ncbi:MAG: hypothetical protein V1840_02150 [Candidatus Omnitrophota bacterium]
MVMAMACLKKLAIVIGISVLAGCSQPLNIQAVKGTWKPATKAYLALGDLTISNDTIAWSSGQKAPFRVVTQDKYDIIVELTGTTYKYLKLTPKDNLVDLEKEDLRVTFYEASQGLDDKNAAEGIYTRH